MVKMDSMALKTEGSEGGSGYKGTSGQAFRAGVMQAVREDIEQEKAGVRRAALVAAGGGGDKQR